MSDPAQYRIDSHKLHLHPRRVADWLEGKDIAPLYMEISPSGACNHRCRFCGMDFMGYKSRFLPVDIMKERLAEMGTLGVKAVMFAGEGEPFLHKGMAEMAEAAKAANIDVAFTTNGVLLQKELLQRIVPVTTWIKVSCNAGTAQTYAQVHGTQASDFERVIKNMTEAVRLRETLGSSCTLGLQMVLLPENMQEATTLAQKARDIGVDYLVIKPYSIHRQSTKEEYKNIQYTEMSSFAEELETYNTENFKVIYRREAIQRSVTNNRLYTHCLALPFWGYIDSGGNVWSCLRRIGEEPFSLGSIISNSAKSVLLGERRKRNLDYSTNNIDINECHVDCRMDVINAYLHELKKPGNHHNFI